MNSGGMCGGPGLSVLVFPEGGVVLLQSNCKTRQIFICRLVTKHSKPTSQFKHGNQENELFIGCSSSVLLT